MLCILKADKSERFKQKCERAKLRSKEKQAVRFSGIIARTCEIDSVLQTIDNLHEQLHQLRQRTEQVKVLLENVNIWI